VAKDHLHADYLRWGVYRLAENTQFSCESIRAKQNCLILRHYLSTEL
jgi:hypothetical protein